jgi:hypothetical protein
MGGGRRMEGEEGRGRGRKMEGEEGKEEEEVYFWRERWKSEVEEWDGGKTTKHAIRPEYAPNLVALTSFVNTVRFIYRKNIYFVPNPFSELIFDKIFKIF